MNKRPKIIVRYRDMDQGPEEDIKTYTENELNQLKELLVQSQTHYKTMISETKHMETLKEGDVLALNLCLAETEVQIKEVDEEIKSRAKD